MIFSDKVQQRQIHILFGAVAALGAIVGILAYMHQLKTDHEDKELKEMEREIKQLQLDELKKRRKNNA